jgi:hypothetical protein
MKNFLSRIFKKNLIRSNENILDIQEDALKKYKRLLRKVKYSKRINGIKVKDIYEVNDISDVSCKIYRRYHYKTCSDSNQLYSKTKLYEFLDDNDANFVVKAKMTNSEKVIYDDFEGDYYWRYYYKIYFSKNNGKTWDKILYDIGTFSLWKPKKSKGEDLISCGFGEIIDYQSMKTSTFDRWYYKIDELVESEFNTYEKCKSRNEKTLRTIMENNANNLSSIFGIDLHLNS